MTTTETTRDWSDLRDDAEQSWEMAVETCHDCEGTIDEARQAECQSAMDAALDAWDRAIAATDAAERVAALEEARALADEWGDDATEREALRLAGGDGRGGRHGLDPRPRGPSDDRRVAADRAAG